MLQELSDEPNNVCLEIIVWSGKQEFGHPTGSDTAEEEEEVAAVAATEVVVPSAAEEEKTEVVEGMTMTRVTMVNTISPQQGGSRSRSQVFLGCTQ